MRIAPFLIGAALALSLAGPLTAQVDSSLRGEHVRLTQTGGLRVEGLLLDAGRDTLALKTSSGVVAVPRATVAHAEWQVGHRALEGLGYGALSGIITGFLLGELSGDDPPCPSGAWFCWRYSAGDKASVGAIALGTLGGLLGLAAGATIPHWEDAPGLSIKPLVRAGASGVRLGASVSF